MQVSYNFFFRTSEIHWLKSCYLYVVTNLLEEVGKPCLAIKRTEEGHYLAIANMRPHGVIRESVNDAWNVALNEPGIIILDSLKI